MSSPTTFKSLALAGFSLLFVSLFFIASPAAHAAGSPQFLMTWKTAGSYVPSFYEGKALPTYGSKITASLELVSSQGKVLDLSGQTIYWYLNDNLIGGGTGVQSVTFSPLGQAPNSLDLRAELPSYNGAYLVHAIQIPMVLPKAVIFSPYPGGEVSQNTITLDALPYFFNVTDPSTLSYTWSVNGQNGASAENPEVAEITLPPGAESGTSLSVSLSVKNSVDSTVGTALENLTFQNQL